MLALMFILKDIQMGLQYSKELIPYMSSFYKHSISNTFRIFRLEWVKDLQNWVIVICVLSGFAFVYLL